MMRVISQGFLSLLFLASSALMAAEPADSAIQSAMDDITRYEQQVAGASKSTLNRTLKLLTITRQRLDSSTNQADPSWAEADARYNALVSQIESALSGGSAPPPAAPAQSAPAAAPAQATATQTPPASRELISQDIVRLKKLARDIDSTTQTMDQAGIKPWQDPAYAEQYQQSLQRYEEQLGKYAEFSGQPEVQAAADALERMRALVKVGLEQGQMAREATGDVQGQLAALYARMRESNPPAAPDPMTADSLNAWLQSLATIRQQAAADYQELAQIKQTAYLPNNVGTVESGAPFDMQNVDSMMNYLQSNVQKLDQSVEQLAANLDVQMQQSAQSLDFYDQADPADDHASANLFLGAGAMEQSLELMDTEITRIESAVAFDRALNRPSLGEREALLSRAQQVRANFIAKRQQALDMSRMPEPASDDDELLEIAHDTISDPRYEIAGYERLVINSDLRHQSKETSEVEFDDVDVSLSGDITLTGTETTTFFEWDEFQVATAEKVGDKYFIFYNTLRKFTRGGSTTPLNRWLISSRFQGSEILEDNIEKH